MLRDHLRDALSVVLPVDCPACGEPASVVPCAECAGELAASAAVTTRLLGPADAPLEVVTGAAYSGVVRRLLLALKEEGRVGAARPLAGVLRPALLHALAGRTAVLVGPPGSYGRRLHRGYDPVELLVRAAGGRVTTPLRRVRASRDQKSLDRSERRGNLDGAFRARRPLVDAPEVVIVDDVVTSGATLLELRRAIEAAGGTVRGAVALAGTPLRSDGDRSADTRGGPHGERRVTLR